MENKPKFWQTNQNSGKQTKILTNKPNADKQSILTKQNNQFKSLEARALLIGLKKSQQSHKLPNAQYGILESWELPMVI